MTTAPGAGSEEAAADPYTALLAGEPVLRGIAEVHGRPDPFSWAEIRVALPTRFTALLLHVVSQQISTAVALVLYGRVADATGGVPEPRTVAGLGVDRLHALGLSRAKAAALVDIAERHLAGTLDTDHLDQLDDDRAVAALTAARGVGPWTAQMFLLHELRRPDVLPAGDLGIRHAVQRAYDLPALPAVEEVAELARRWSPWRSYAAALLWASLGPAPPSAAPSAAPPDVQAGGETVWGDLDPELPSLQPERQP